MFLLANPAIATRLASGVADHATPLNLAAKIGLIGIVRGAKERAVIDRRRLAQLMESPQAYLSEARALPHFTKDGQLDGVG